MSRLDVVRAVTERIHDCAAQERELAVLEREGMLDGSQALGEALDAIYGIATRALAEPSDTAALLAICEIIEGLRG